MRLLVTRPLDDARAMTQRLEADGHAVTIEPLMEIERTDPGPFDLIGVQALLASSRNAVRAIADHSQIEELRQLPLFAVGQGTAAAAGDCGFARVIAGPAAGRELAAIVAATAVPSAGRLLHLSGETVADDFTAALCQAGLVVERRIVYRARSRQGFTGQAENFIRSGAIDGVILMSPRTAAVYAEIIEAGGLRANISNVVHFCLSTAVAARLSSLSPLQLVIAVRPNLEEMLALVGRVAAQSAQRS